MHKWQREFVLRMTNSIGKDMSVGKQEPVWEAESSSGA